MVASIILTSLLSLTTAHMELMQPYAIRSQFDPENDYTNIDYSLVAPLAADGSNYPCKGYHKDLANRHVVAQYTPGNSYEAVMAGSSPHRGGSCQLALSYDDGETFYVIKSHIGGCPCPNGIDCDNGGVSGNMRIPFTIPSDAPAAENILFAWGWHNWEGNREYYMNCAAVDILGDNTSGLGGLPELFVANIVGDQCKLDYGTDIYFPNPGNDVAFGKGYTESNHPAPFDAEGKGCPSYAASLPPVVVGGGSVPTSSTRSSSSTRTTSSSSSSTRTTYSSPSSTRTTSSSSTRSSSSQVTSSRTSSTRATTSAASTGTTDKCTAGEVTCETAEKRRNCIDPAVGFVVEFAPTGATCNFETNEFNDAEGNVVDPLVVADGADCAEGYAECETAEKLRKCVNGQFTILYAPEGTSCSNGQFVDGSGTPSTSCTQSTCKSNTVLSRCVNGSVQEETAPSGFICANNIFTSESDTSGSCSFGIKCSSDGSSFYQCSNGNWQDFGSVPSGFKCENDDLVAA